MCINSCNQCVTELMCSEQVNYDEKTGKGKEEASDYSSQSDDSGDDSGGEGSKPASKVCFSWLCSPETT